MLCCKEKVLINMNYVGFANLFSNFLILRALSVLSVFCGTVVFCGTLYGDIINYRYIQTQHTAFVPMQTSQSLTKSNSLLL